MLNDTYKFNKLEVEMSESANSKTLYNFNQINHL